MAFTTQLPDLFRLDFRVYYKRVKEKYTSILGLDLLNATNQENVAFNYYDPFTENVTSKFQIGNYSESKLSHRILNHEEYLAYHNDRSISTVCLLAIK